MPVSITDRFTPPPSLINGPHPCLFLHPSNWCPATPSWGNIMDDVSNSYVLTEYWFIWIPAGLLLLLTVLAFNLVGDGLRDAFDPKMKR